MTSFRQCEGAFLLKTPDLLLTDFDAPRSSAIVDIKIVDSSAAACYVNSQHHLQISSSRHTEPWRLPVPVTTLYFGPSRRPPPGARMRVLVTFVTSTFGSFGVQAQALIKDIGRRTNLFVPPSLSPETSWATSSITTFLRSAYLSSPQTCCSHSP